MTRARACIKCREYALIDASDPINQEKVKVFEGKHRGHTLITLDLSEVEGTYKDFEKEEPSESSE